MSETSDKDLALRASAGDREAFGALVDRHQDMALCVARKLLRDAEDAEDAAQEAFLRAWQALGRLQDPTRFGPWLARVTRNICLNRLRRRRAAGADVSLDAFEEAGAFLATVEPADHLQAELIGRVRVLAGRLPEPYREAFELRYACGYSCRRVAEFLGTSPRTVIMWLYRARKTILRGLKEEGLA
jgi:RNA polymerase sigma-70 factor (ECF subfamily)